MAKGCAKMTSDAYEVLPDPRAVQVLHIHRTIPDTVQIGHFGRGGVDFGEFDASVLDHLHEIRHLSNRRAGAHWSPGSNRLTLRRWPTPAPCVRFDFLT